MVKGYYSPKDFGGKKEEELVRLFKNQRDDARIYFINCIKPRLDRWFKLYIGDNRDRAAEIQDWQANIFVPYTQAVVETLKPRILDARPDMQVQGRNEESQPKATRLNGLLNYNWEIDKADVTSELIVGASLVYGTAYIQSSWKKDTRTLKFLKTKNIVRKTLTWEEREETFYDAPHMEWVDNYSLWYDWHNIDAGSKQYWFKRLVLTGEEIKRRYPMAEKKRLELALSNPGGDLTNYASIRNEVKLTHEHIVKGADGGGSATINFNTQFNAINQFQDSDIPMYEVFEWWRPFDDKYSVFVNEIPIFKGGEMPNPYDFKESPFTAIQYLKVAGEFEGYGIPALLENPQIMLNMVKNQRLDAMTLNIHKMWIVNPLANIRKEELVMRPFGIIYSIDPNGAREVQTSDIKPSAYREEELLKGDMRYASGVDDFSMGVGGGGSSATEVRHLRESTLERVRLYVNHLGDGYSVIMRHWISMYRQFFTKERVIRIMGDNGEYSYPVISKDDLTGEFDFKATVLPSVAGQNDIKKKQDMDLFQLLINLPFVDPEKLVSKILYDFNWSIDSVKKNEAQQPGQPGMEGMPPPGAEGEMSPEQLMAMAAQEGEGAPPQLSGGGENIPPDVMSRVLELLGSKKGATGSYSEGAAGVMSELGSPMNILKGGPPPTAPGLRAGGGKPDVRVPLKTTNTRGMNRTGKVNTNVPLKDTTNPEANLMNRVLNIQK